MVEERNEEIRDRKEYKRRGVGDSHKLLAGRIWKKSVAAHF
jgi:hypothetical protein